MKMYLVVVEKNKHFYILYLNAKDSIEVKEFCNLINCEHISFCET